jgi:CRISPR-associated protein Cas5d
LRSGVASLRTRERGVVKQYSVSFEVAGPAAIFTRPDSGASFVSYPAPTYSALKGMFECVARWKSAYIRPARVEICNPIQFQRYATNYGGPLRHPKQVRGHTSYQLFATILIDVCYKVHGDLAEAAPCPGGHNHLHALQDLFQRRLNQGRFYRTPCLGWSEFVPTYFGPLRETTRARTEIDATIPSMLRRVFDRDTEGQYDPAFDHDVRIVNGVLCFA